MITYKGYNKDLTCTPLGNSFQYEIGKTYDNGGKNVTRRGNGAFHSVEMPQDMFTYYGPATSRYTVTEPGGEIAREAGSDSKIASSEITIGVELSLGDIARRAVAWVAAATKNADASTAGNYAHSSTAGNYAHSSTAGNYAHSSTAGERAHSSTAGYYAHSSTAGNYAHSSTAGERAHSSTAGYYAHSSTAGNYAHSSTAGERAHSSTAGYYAHSSTAGYGAHSSTAGERAHSSTAGESAHSSTAGNYAHSSVKGINSVAHAAGADSTAQACEGSAISLAAYDDKWDLVAVRSSLVGQNGIEAGKTYRLTVKGEFEEVKN